MKKYILKIEPAVPFEVRYKIYDLLKSLDYKMIGSGKMTDGSSCDISFEKKEEK